MGCIYTYLSVQFSSVIDTNIDIDIDMMHACRKMSRRSARMATNTKESENCCDRQSGSGSTLTTPKARCPAQQKMVYQNNGKANNSGMRRRPRLPHVDDHRTSPRPNDSPHERYIAVQLGVSCEDNPANIQHRQTRRCTSKKQKMHTLRRTKWP